MSEPTGRPATAGTGIFGGAAAADFTAKLIAADRASASRMINDALRAVLEAGDDLDPVEAENGLVTVAALVAEEQPSVLQDAADPDALRQRLVDLDTELTPARRTAARGVITRVLLPQANSWLSERSKDQDWPQVSAAIDDLSQVLAEA